MKPIQLTIIIFFFSPLILFSQNKYAMLVGIDEYYIHPGVKHKNSLRGCVNDVYAIKGLLLNRLGFKETGIQVLVNEKATKENLLNLLKTTLNRCIAGDVVVFYFSGHGAWMSNPKNINDAVKRGLSQSIVMSNLYAPGLECLVTDEMLKKQFNNFVDKKTVMTAIFDCCYSGMLAFGYDEHYWDPGIYNPTQKGHL